MIEETKTDSKEHLGNAKNNSQFHFERVQECNLVLCWLPNLKVNKKQGKKKNTGAEKDTL